DGVEVSYNFFKNPPGQTLAAFVSLMFFCIKARKEMGRRVHFELNSIRIEPHTSLFKLAVEEGVIKENENLLYPIYYINRKTAYIDVILNMLLRLLGK
ncbi:MAG: B12-binding domain-containing radical SAM protein, partial [Nitrospirae bacterium]|nr:B12-binding domain-containing radical SAM protein [Nitrospirota bacterium]